MLVKVEPKICREPGCGMSFYFLKNQATNKMIPVDVKSLSPEDILQLRKFMEVDYDNTRHVSHFKTCKNPNRFSKKGKK